MDVRRGGIATDHSRLLIHVPILHSEADMGALAPSVRRVTEKKLGRQAWRRQANAVGRMWADLQQTVEGWELPWHRVRLYQDGLPVCGREVEIVKSLASAGSPNHRLLLTLMERGATVMGTESPDLLVQEYRLVKEGLEASGLAEPAARRAAREARSRALLVRRDRYIARRIHHTLRAGEIGLLFLGMLHSIEPSLPRDIEVVHPIHRPPGSERRET